MRDSGSASSVVVGIDGSRWAIEAALWAVDEAVGRDIPLRLVCAIDTVTAGLGRAAHELANAETAIRYAVTAVESTGKPAKIEVQIVQRRPVSALLAVSRSAAMICVGSTGLHHATRGRVGSTAAALAASAHCPVAVVHRPATRTRCRPNLVIAVVNRFPDGDAIVERGIEEAMLRAAPLRIMTARLPQSADRRGTDGRHQTSAELSRRLTRWRRRYPDLDIAADGTDCGVLSFLKSNAESVQLVVVGPPRSGALEPIFGPAGRTTLDDVGCTVLVCDVQGRL